MNERPGYGGEVLCRFGLDEASALGAGGESRVYALDEKRVLRVYGPGTAEAKVETLQRFYAELDTSAVDFAVPDVLEMGREGGFVFSIESRLIGRSLATAVRDLSDDARRSALRGLVRAAGEVRRLRGGFGDYGELLAEKPLRRESWVAFLVDRAGVTLQQSQAYLSEDVPGLDDIVAAWAADMRVLVGSPEPELVHGDYFPGNVLVDDSGELIAVIDFSPMTVSGDWRLDIAGAQVFLELGGVTQSDDIRLVERELADRYEVSPAVIDVYRRYYALYFSAAKKDDPPLYDWCVAQLARTPADQSDS